MFDMVLLCTLYWPHLSLNALPIIVLPLPVCSGFSTRFRQQGGGIFHNRNTLNSGALPCWKSGHWGTEQTYGLSTRTCNHRPWLTIMLSHKRKIGVFNFHFYRQITPLCSQFVPKGELGTCTNRVTDPCCRYRVSRVTKMAVFHSYPS